VSPRYSPLNAPAILFAHRGARAHAPDNTLEAFRLALRLGATGLESDAWITADGEVVLDHDGVVGGVLRRRRIGDVSRDQLPAHIPTLGELYDACGPDVELSLDVKDPQAVDEIVRIAAAVGDPHRLWLCHPDVELLASWREEHPEVRLVNSTRLASMDDGPERRAAQLRSAGIDAVNLHQGEWTAGLVALFHRFGRMGFGWDAQHPRTIGGLLDAGIDGVFSDHVDRLVDCAGAEERLLPRRLRAEPGPVVPGDDPADPGAVDPDR
jgi:glycerophosphoryl diester phosphodiesterase